MAGNVWEWCSDWYDAEYYRQFNNRLAVNPAGPEESFDPEEPYAEKKLAQRIVSVQRQLLQRLPGGPPHEKLPRHRTGTYQLSMR